MGKGLFIVIDGTDGSGKATQTKILVDKLLKDGFDVEVTDFPRYGKRSATLVEDYLNGKFGSAEEVGPYRASIFYACDRYAASHQIKKWIRQGKIIVSNRYVSANMGHQAGKIKNKDDRDKFLDWLYDLEFNIFNIPKPDIILFLYIAPGIGQILVDKKGYRDYIKGNKRDIHETDLNHLKGASEAYKYAAEKFGWTKIDCAPDGTINSLRTPEDIHEEVYQCIMKILLKFKN